MDPQATWNELLRAWNADDADAAHDAANTLLEWLRKRGAAPVTIEQLSKDDPLHEVIATATCEAVAVYTFLGTLEETVDHDNQNQGDD
ncbi:hypothetical protein Q31b_00930 [Novipirellula aureliae]|uniref:Uncharacterized protein n=1 Tax=Novipirellula aureliae TaxID=2527966 RepID=A0A5C6E7J4_9BACT|nr:hypothetical protein [Novipirellula aureliae]TWU44922.1 hypothetical protein Q31b_00930 [Novipirellula aureliae]